MNHIEQIDKDCLDAHIEELLRLIEQKDKLEQKINFQKENIAKFAKENGVLYSDSKFTISLVFTPKVVWNDIRLDMLEQDIKEYEEEIKQKQAEQKEYKDKKAALLKEHKDTIKEYCKRKNKSVTEVYKQFDFITSLESSYHIRIEETNKVKSNEKTWIFKKE